jgi:hypothetical protein
MSATKKIESENATLAADKLAADEAISELRTQLVRADEGARADRDRWSVFETEKAALVRDLERTTTSHAFVLSQLEAAKTAESAHRSEMATLQAELRAMQAASTNQTGKGKLQRVISKIHSIRHSAQLKEGSAEASKLANSNQELEEQVRLLTEEKDMYLRMIAALEKDRGNGHVTDMHAPIH